MHCFLMLVCLDIVDCKDCNVKRSCIGVEASLSTFRFILSIFNINYNSLFQLTGNLTKVVSGNRRDHIVRLPRF